MTYRAKNNIISLSFHHVIRSHIAIKCTINIERQLNVRNTSTYIIVNNACVKRV